MLWDRSGGGGDGGGGGGGMLGVVYINSFTETYYK